MYKIRIFQSLDDLLQEFNKWPIDKSLISVMPCNIGGFTAIYFETVRTN